VSTHVAGEAAAVDARRRSARTAAIYLLGPLAGGGGLVWAFAQPYRITLLDPRGESFWWLAVQPPLLVMLVAIVFHFFVAPGLIEDVRRAAREEEE
jgi:hypothetical protein